ncbi:MAG: hypothetical protein ABSA04_13340 [Desulfobaccales bacterium]|jgi:hypothetical protein
MFFRRKLFLAAVVLSALIICLVGPAAAVTTWDVTTDFSATSDPNGAWSYGYEATGAGPLTLFTLSGNAPNAGDGWYLPNPLQVPSLWKNNSSSTQYGVLPGEVSLQPAYGDTALVVARWTSPITGSVTLSGSFGAGDQGLMDYYIYENGANIFTFISTALTGNVTESFNLGPLAVIPGTTIDFAVGPGPNGYGYGNTPLDATIVPIPGALWLLGSGLAGLGLLRRKWGLKA